MDDNANTPVKPKTLLDLPTELLDDIIRLALPQRLSKNITTLHYTIFNRRNGLINPYRAHPKLYAIAIEEVPKFITATLDLRRVLVREFHANYRQVIVQRPFEKINKTLLQKVVHLELSIPLGCITRGNGLLDHESLTNQAIHFLENLGTFCPKLRSIVVKIDLSTYPPIEMYQPSNMALTWEESELKKSMGLIAKTVMAAELGKARLCFRRELAIYGPENDCRGLDATQVVQRMFALGQAAKVMVLA